MLSRAEPIEGVRCRQGEGPRWDRRTDSLVWVDMKADALHVAEFHRGSLSRHRRFPVGRPIGSAAPLAGVGQGWVCAAGQGFLHVAESGEVRVIADDIGGEGPFFNDGVADPAGRFWAGTQSVPRVPTSSLYSLEADGRVVVRLRDVTVSNGIAFTPDGGSMYYIDTLPHRTLEIFSVAANGTLSDRRSVVEIPDGQPDGIAVDAEGAVWVAVWGTGQVRRYLADGSHVATVEVPVPLVSAVTLLGNILVVTTAQERDRTPLAQSGMRFEVEVEVPGRPADAWLGSIDLILDDRAAQRVSAGSAT